MSIIKPWSNVRPFQSSPAHINSPSYPRLDPIDSKSSYRSFDLILSLKKVGQGKAIRRWTTDKLFTDWMVKRILHTYHSTNPRLKGWDMGHGILDGFYLNLINQTQTRPITQRGTQNKVSLGWPRQFSRYQETLFIFAESSKSNMWDYRLDRYCIMYIIDSSLVTY